MKILIKYVLATLLLSLPWKASAGIEWVEIGVNGLTCSMCTRSVEMSIMRLDFVDSVVMDLETTEGKVYLKSEEPADLKRIARAIVNAGFTVRFVKLHFNFTDVAVNDDGIFEWNGQPFEWIDFKKGVANKEADLKLVDEEFLTRKENSQWKKKLEHTSKTDSQKTLHVVLD